MYEEFEALPRSYRYIYYCAWEMGSGYKNGNTLLLDIKVMKMFLFSDLILKTKSVFNTENQ